MPLTPGALYFDSTCHDPSRWGLKVYNWDGHNIHFPVDAPNHRPRKRHANGTPDIRFGVLHWTGGEGTYRAVARTLRARKLGIPFFVDYHGRLFQFSDPATTVSPHAGAVNGYCWGVEVQNRGIAKGEYPQRRYASQRIHGHRYQVAAFSAAQVETVVALCEAMAMLCKHPRQVPGHLNLLPEAERPCFRGVLGHLHVSPRKTDPGEQLFTALMKAGWATQDLQRDEL